ncbi:hypothetical protein D3C80_1828460 [compost metagenome]
MNNVETGSSVEEIVSNAELFFSKVFSSFRPGWAFNTEMIFSFNWAGTKIT